MSVIPFNPGSGRGSLLREPGIGAPACRPAAVGEAGVPADRESRGAGSGAAEQRRIEVLERVLLATLRENAINWAKAERAERLLGGTDRMQRPGG